MELERTDWGALGPRMLMTGREERWQCDRQYACMMRSKIWSLPSQTNTKSRFDIDLKAVYAPACISIATPKQSESSALITGREHTQMAAVFHKSTNGCYILIPRQAQTVAPGPALSKLTFPYLRLSIHTTPKAIMKVAIRTQIPNPKTCWEPLYLALLGSQCP